MKQKLVFILILLIGLYLLLLIPDTDKRMVTNPVGNVFTWNQDSLWLQLEKDFTAARNQPQAIIDSNISTLMNVAKGQYRLIEGRQLLADDIVFDSILENYFHLASFVAASDSSPVDFLDHYNLMRQFIKQQSIHWNLDENRVRNTVYKMLYGMRMATEEVLLQQKKSSFDAVLTVTDEPSQTPSAMLMGMKVHSGDLLVSRGGAEVSAMISRGNNYPGNFSHIALIYVEEKTARPFLIEAHIEKGVAISSAAQYVKDEKLRCMVLRPRANLPQLKADALLPHKAARLFYYKAQREHLPYDFKMNFHDSTAMFCSEVGSYAYKQMGVQLWQAMSTISSEGVINWLSAFGVENFVTQMPADLEYDSQLSVVAEWRNPATLMKDHIDNAVMDVLLEEADRGKEIHYNHWQLPFVRMVKLWCMIKNKFGATGIIPEGMSATQALKNQEFVAMYKKVKDNTLLLSDEFIKENNYQPPYWQLLILARKSIGRWNN